MTRPPRNTQLFALAAPPPAELEIAAARYSLVRVFKHDFLAATCLYEPSPAEHADTTAEGAQGHAWARVVVKFMRERPFMGLPLAWAAKLLADHEQAIYRALAGAPGVPRWVARLGAGAFAIEYIDGRPLDHDPPPPAGFFDRLRELFAHVHARGVGYCDANKRSNILVGPAGAPFLVDYQISIRRRDDWPWPFSAIAAAAVRYVAAKDLYHLCKHKRRICPRELSPEEQALSRERRGLHWLHRKLTDPWRAIRRRFLRRQFAKGALVSPTASLENHDQPEKATWRE